MRILTCHGHLPGAASVPPTTNACATSSDRVPHVTSAHATLNTAELGHPAAETVVRPYGQIDMISLFAVWGIAVSIIQACITVIKMENS